MATTVRKTPRAAAAPTTSKAAPARRRAPAPARAQAPALAPELPTPAPAKPAEAAKPAKAAKPVKARVKLVRDSFTMPDVDVALIAQLKARALEARRPARKSELLRAGLHALTALNPAQLVAALDALIPVKTGRPKKGH